MKPDLLKIKKVKNESHDTWSFELTSNNKFKRMAPGQFNMVYVPGLGESAISVSCLEKNKIVHTVRKVGRVTNDIVKLKTNGIMALRGPYGRGWPMETLDKNHIVVVAGGIGLAPLRPVIMELIVRSKTRTAKGFISQIYYGSRNPAERIFVKELTKWQKMKSISFLETVDQATGKWRGNVGVVTSLINTIPAPSEKVVVMLCGPEIMIRFSALKLIDLGVKPENIFVSLERNMKCAVGFCGHCQLGPKFICKDGPVFTWPEVESLMKVRFL